MREAIAVKVQQWPDGEVSTEDVEARSTEVPELWIHRTLYRDLRPETYHGRRWTVTHRPTGRSAYRADTLRQALAYVRAVKGADWSFQDPKAMASMAETHKAARAHADAA